MRRFLAVTFVLVACGDDDLAAFEPSDPLDAGLQDASLDAELMIDGSADAGITPEFHWELPAHFPRPLVPANNPMSVAKVELGRHLFHDTRLSVTGTFSCASCHKQELAFTDGRATGLGATGAHHPRGATSLANVAYTQTLAWANPQLTTLEQQLLVPLLGDNPVELGLSAIPQAEEILRAIPAYAALFEAAFPDEPAPITMTNTQRALACFQRSVLSTRSAYDRYLERGVPLSESAERGMRLVTTGEDPRFVCHRCHGGFAFSDQTRWEGKNWSEPVFHQTGLHDIDGLGGYPAPNTGVHELSFREDDMGKFRAPTLRNVGVTAPYMHDGSLATLDDVLDHYARGGRARSARTDPLLQPFTISAQERADVIAFLHSLTDEALLTDPRFANPWPPAR